jgi:hypothetical protein
MILRHVMNHSDLTAIRDRMRRWLSAPAPCEISHEDPFNPCLPEDGDDGWLTCLTCFRRQQPALTAPPRTGDQT